MIIGYIDSQSRNIGIEAQKSIISNYAKDSGIAVDMFSSEDDIQKLLSSLQTSDHTVLLANIVCLGNKLNIIKDNLQKLIDKGLNVITIKENYKFSPSKEMSWLIKGIDLSLEIRNSMVSIVTKNALGHKKEQGIRLGRGLGCVNKKHAWEGKEEIIKERILAGYNRAEIATEMGMSVGTLYNFLRARPDIKNTNNGANNA